MELTLLAWQGRICRKDQSLMQGLALLLLSTGCYMDRKKGERTEKLCMLIQPLALPFACFPQWKHWAGHQVNIMQQEMDPDYKLHCPFLVIYG